MATAVISDIHGNLDALKAVMANIRKRGIQKIVCLGDMIGYGPNPRECLDLLMEVCEWTLLGNHDFASMFEPTGFHVGAAQAAYWTRQELESETNEELRRKRWKYLGRMRIRATLDGAMCVHASPRRPIDEYIFPDDPITAPAKMFQIFEYIKDRCFVGHTHVPGVFTDEPDFYRPTDIGKVYVFNDDEKCIINPGSVGQPRDRDPRASYAIVHKDRVEFVRVPYNIHLVVEKFRAIPALNDFLGLRLMEGR